MVLSDFQANDSVDLGKRQILESGGFVPTFHVERFPQINATLLFVVGRFPNLKIQWKLEQEGRK